jgi:signal transduction histidine kinase
MLNAERGDDFTKRAAEFAATIHRAGQDLLGLINTFLDVTRIESGRFELAEDRIEVANLVAACVRQATPDARAGDVTIWIDLPKSLPVLHGDERRLRQVLSHVLSNAVKFTPAGGSVRVEASQMESGALQIRVIDSGIGIAEADQKRVFEPFVQLDSGLARRTGGSGLGLYVTRALLTAHGGELTLTSRPGQGTTVILQLPASRLRI